MWRCIFLFVILTPYSIGGFWDRAQIDKVFAFVAAGEAEEAHSLVQTWGATAHDFGLDILTQGHGTEALEWFDAIIPLYPEDNDINRVARAWVLRAQGYSEDARAEAVSCTYSENILAQARAHYLLALMSRSDGEMQDAFDHAQQARELFVMKNRHRGKEYCDELLDFWSRGKSSNHTNLSDGSQGPPPTDSGGA